MIASPPISRIGSKENCSWRYIFTSWNLKTIVQPMILKFLIFYHQFEDLSCKNKRCISIVLRMWHADNRWLNMLFEAKNQTELNSNFLTPKGPILSIQVHGWFHMCLVHSYGVQFIQLKIGFPRGLLHYGQYKRRIDASNIFLQNKSDNMWRF